MALYDEVRRRHAAGEPLLALSRRMGLARGTVRKYAGAESFPERAVRAPGPSLLDPYLAHLEARLAERCENAMELWRELRSLGYPGTARQVHRWLNPRRNRPSKYGPKLGDDTETARAASSGNAPALPSPRQLAWSLTRPRECLTQEEDATVERIQQDALAATVSTLVRRFADLVRGQSLGATPRGRAPMTALRGWLRDASRSGVAALITFANGLQQDSAAVKAALSMPRSSGQTEGQVNKLELLKRQTFGRASFDLLRRVLLAN
ncbi:transposase (plasmid) [Roseomonas sp. CCTCC AB2023176]|uniref:transposase n=1 Tax=Roseomonas sp. CCTCC AB2023176 TaxID=3342640 RepID=UPI0035DC4A69